MGMYNNCGMTESPFLYPYIYTFHFDESEKKGMLKGFLSHSFSIFIFPLSQCILLDIHTFHLNESERNDERVSFSLFSLSHCIV